MAHWSADMRALHSCAEDRDDSEAHRLGLNRHGSGGRQQHGSQARRHVAMHAAAVCLVCMHAAKDVPSVQVCRRQVSA